MASPIIAFLAGAGSGYLKQRGVEEDRQRQAEDQAFQNEQREVWRKQQAEADTLNTNLKNAQASAEVVEGDVGDQSAGPPIPAPLRQQPAIAAAQLGGTGQPATQSATATTMAGQVGTQMPAQATPQVFRMVAPGGVNRTFNSAAEAHAAAKEYSSPEATNARFVAAYRGAGQVDKAMEVERNAMQGQAARMQLDDGIKARAAKDANARLMQAMGGGAAGLQRFFDRSNLVNGAQVGFDTGKDGKVQFYTLDSEGKKNLMGAAVENTEEALSRAVMPYWQGLDAIQYIDILHRQGQADRQQSNADRSYALDVRKLDADIAHKKSALAVTAARGAGAKTGVTGAPEIDLLYGFDPKQAMGEAYNRAAKAAEAAAAEGKPMTQQQVAQYAQDGFEAMRRAAVNGNQQRLAASAVSSALNSVKDDPAAYADTYKQVIAKGITAQQLERMGFASPEKAAEKSSAKPVVATPIGMQAPAGQAKTAGTLPIAEQEAASRANYQQFLRDSGSQSVAARQAELSEKKRRERQEKEARDAEREAERAAQRRQIGAGAEALKRGSSVRDQ